MIKEFPAENRAELVVPTCPQCQRYMVRDNIHGKLGSDNNTRQKGANVILDPLTMGPNVTLLVMTFRCRKHRYGVRIGTEDLIKLNQYPANNVRLTDRDGNEL
jgi:hypothetical protein